jgi:ABC-type transport system involved in multi-copper enzyme maturation permease subunit
MLGRELAIALRSRASYLQAAVSALLVGHGFVLACDLYSASSRSAAGNLLMRRELDPLLGVIRPTLGGLYLSLSLLGPAAAARLLSVEKERRTLYALLLQTASPARVLGAKLVAACAALALQLVAPLALFALFATLGGHLALGETLVSLLGYELYLLLVAALSLAAASFAASLAQAVTLALLVVVSSWAIDASEGFAALAWLGNALDWSVTRQLAPLEHGTLALSACGFLLALTAGALALAAIGLRSDRSALARGALVGAVLVATACAGLGARGLRRGFDFTEARRASLPPAVERELRALPGTLVLELWLDRDDARRTELEGDALAKLRLARPDLAVRAPLDGKPAPVEGEREPGYGRIVVRVNGATRETYSTSRRELATLIFEAAGRPLPDFSQPEYRGYPWVVQGARRSLLAGVAYFGLPGVLLFCGLVCSRSGRKR